MSKFNILEETGIIDSKLEETPRTIGYYLFIDKRKYDYKIKTEK